MDTRFPTAGRARDCPYDASLEHTGRQRKQCRRVARDARIIAARRSAHPCNDVELSRVAITDVRLTGLRGSRFEVEVLEAGRVRGFVRRSVAAAVGALRRGCCRGAHVPRRSCDRLPHCTVSSSMAAMQAHGGASFLQAGGPGQTAVKKGGRAVIGAAVQARLARGGWRRRRERFCAAPQPATTKQSGYREAGVGAKGPV